MTVELVTPLGLVRTPSAANTFDAFFGGPFTGPLQVILRRILWNAQISMILVLDEADAASGNKKLHAFAMSPDPDVLREHKPCGLRQNHLIVTALLKALGTVITSRMYQQC